MNRNCLGNPKVRYKLGEGGAPEEAGTRLALLKESYREGAAMLESMGFNGIDVFDLELPQATKTADMTDKKKIEELMEDNSFRAGKLIGCGVSIINAGVAVEARKQKLVQIEKEKEKKERDEKVASLNSLDDAILYYEQ